jgi:hypothetical protein
MVLHAITRFGRSADQMSVASGFRRNVDEICALLGRYSVSSGNLLPTFRDNISVPTHCPGTSLKDYHSTLRSTPEEGRSEIPAA